MVRDSRVRMRSGLVVPGVLLTIFGLVAIIYAEIFRAETDFCADSNLILIAGICYTVWKLILPLVLIGLALAIAGATAFRGYPDDLEGHLHHGTPSHTGFWLLLSLVVGPAGLWLTQVIRQSIFDTVYEVSFLGVTWEHTFILEILMLIGLLAFLPYLFLYLGMNRRRMSFVAAASLAAQEVPKPLPHEEHAFEDTLQGEHEQEQDMVPDADWPAQRDVQPESGFVGCSAKAGGQSCTQPVRSGTKYCNDHGCAGLTKDGHACGNEAVAAGLCAVHQDAD